ncbi:MAG: ATP-binding protein [Treponema sp.]|nr:ATP-binding protein [Treponema sp.]
MEGIFNTILIKDVCVREKINDVTLLQRIVKTVCSNVGSPISSKRITDTLVSSGRRISGNTVERYLNALCEAFIFYEVPRFDVRGNEILKTLGKYYLADTGLRNILIGSRTDDFGHVLENLVYLELKRRGCQVYVGKAGEAEIDFVTKKGGAIEYYQVSASILDESTRRRELEAFSNVRDNYPKYILTLDDFDFGALNGIQHKNIIEWMLGK